MVCSCNACFSYANSSIDFVLTLLVTRPLLANSGCPVNLLKESGTLVSHPASCGDCVSYNKLQNC